MQLRMCFKLYIAKPDKIIRRNQNSKYIENDFKRPFLKRTLKKTLIVGEITMFMDGNTKGISSLYNIVGGIHLYTKGKKWKIIKLFGEMVNPGQYKKCNKNEPRTFVIPESRMFSKLKRVMSQEPRANLKGLPLV